MLRFLFLLNHFVEPAVMRETNCSNSHTKQTTHETNTLQLSTVHNHHIHLGLVVVACLRLLDLVDNVHSLHHLAKHHVFAVQVRARHRGNKELRAVRVRTRIRHAQHSLFRVLQRERLVRKLLAVNRAAARSVELREIAALNHEVVNHAVEDRVLVAQSHAVRVGALLARAQTSEVLAGLRSLFLTL